MNVPGLLVEKNYEDSSSIGSRIIEKSEGFAKYSAARGRSERKFFRQIFVYFPDGRPKNKFWWVDKKNLVIENKTNNQPVKTRVICSDDTEEKNYGFWQLRHHNSKTEKAKERERIPELKIKE